MGAALAALALGLGLAAPPGARAADEPARLEGSVRTVPADAAFYVAFLRNREQIEAIAQSKAWAKLMDLPAVKSLGKMVKAEVNKPGSDWEKAKEVWNRPEVREVVELVGEMASDEIFLYGDERWVGLLELYGQLFGSSYRQVLSAAMKGGGKLQQPEMDRTAKRAMLHALKENVDRIQVPDLVIGFKIRNQQRARTQLDRLEKLLKDTIAEKEPKFKDRLQRKQLAGGEFLTFTFTGKDLGVDTEKSLRELEDKPGDADELAKKLSKLQYTLTLGVQGDYVLATFGESSAVVEKFGRGQRLIDRPELKPLLRHADKRLTSIAYASKSLRRTVGFTRKDVDGWVRMAEDALKEAQAPADLKDRLRKDLHALAKDVKGFISEPGAYVAYSFLNGRGQEAYEYDYGEHPHVESTKPLTLLNHVGGSPLLAAVGRSHGLARGYEFLAKWAQVANGYFEDFAVPQMGAQEKEKYEQAAKQFHPLVRRFHEATTKLLLPALDDGQSALVIDAKLSSKQWVKILPPTEKPMPMLELGLVLGVSDAGKFREAFAEYRAIINKAIDYARETQPQVPNFQIPPPEVRKIKGGELFYYPLPPQLPLDEQLLPNAGLSARVAVFSLSQNHTERLLQRTPLKVREGPLADTTRPLASATYCNWPGFVDALTPWIELGVQMGLSQGVPGAKAEAELGTPEDILKQARTVLEVLKVFRSYTSVTYMEDGALVTHSETVIQDLQ
jgi:hypothetical protein